MLRETAQTKVPDGAPVVTPPLKPPSHEELVEERMEMIIHLLHRIDRREKWRSVWGFFHGLITFLPLLAFAGSLWYVYMHGQDIMQEISKTAAQQAGQYSQDSMGRLIDQFKGYFPGMSGSSSSSSVR